MYDYWADTAQAEGWLEPERVEKLTDLLDKLFAEDAARSEQMRQYQQQIEKVLFSC